MSRTMKEVSAELTKLSSTRMSISPNKAFMADGAKQTQVKRILEQAIIDLENFLNDPSEQTEKEDLKWAEKQIKIWENVLSTMERFG